MQLAPRPISKHFPATAVGKAARHKVVVPKFFLLKERVAQGTDLLDERDR
jgi:hypothetical protein